MYTLNIANNWATVLLLCLRSPHWTADLMASSAAWDFCDIPVFLSENTRMVLYSTTWPLPHDILFIIHQLSLISTLYIPKYWTYSSEYHVMKTYTQWNTEICEMSNVFYQENNQIWYDKSNIMKYCHEIKSGTRYRKISVKKEMTKLQFSDEATWAPEKHN
jgi:hypothetical protein